MKPTKPTHKVSSGNVFADLGVGNPEEAQAKAELASKIADILEERKLTQAKAASLLDIDQPKVSALVNGHLTAFSTERLIRFLTLLGRDVEIVIKSKRRTLGHLNVISA
jgi:predicted XRE-type DNA-binding protein